MCLSQNCVKLIQTGGRSPSVRLLLLQEVKVMKYVCSVCGFIYDETEGYPDGGIDAGTKWEDVPEDFVCPLCGVGKDQFEAE